MTSLDHLEPVMYRTTLRTSEQAREKGLRKVLIGVVTGDMDMSFSFEESSERAYAAMLKVGVWCVCCLDCSVMGCVWIVYV